LKNFFQNLLNKNAPSSNAQPTSTNVSQSAQISTNDQSGLKFQLELAQVLQSLGKKFLYVF